MMRITFIAIMLLIVLTIFTIYKTIKAYDGYGRGSPSLEFWVPLCMILVGTWIMTIHHLFLMYNVYDIIFEWLFGEM